MDKRPHCCIDSIQECLLALISLASHQWIWTISPFSTTQITVPAKVSAQEWPRRLPQSSGQCCLLIWRWGVWGKKPRNAPLLSLWEFQPWLDPQRSLNPSSLNVRPTRRPCGCRPGLTHSQRGRSHRTDLPCCRRPAGRRWSCLFFQSYLPVIDDVRWTSTSSHDRSWIVLREKWKQNKSINSDSIRLLELHRLKLQQKLTQSFILMPLYSSVTFQS